LKNLQKEVETRAARESKHLRPYQIQLPAKVLVVVATGDAVVEAD
jgi:hypothetical protein